jgi:hypothetical protein
VTLQEIEAGLHRKPELDKLAPKVVEALALAVVRFVSTTARDSCTVGTWSQT